MKKFLNNDRRFAKVLESGNFGVVRLLFISFSSSIGAWKSDLAFVEFENETQAGGAKEHLSAWDIDGKRVSVSFAKR